MKKNILIAILLLGIITACSAGPTEEHASSSTEPAAPTNPPSPTEMEVPTPIIEQPTPTSDPSVQTAIVSFSLDVMPILKSRCFNCHGGRETEEGLDMSTYASLMAGSDNGLVIVPGDAANSLLAEQLLAQKMPKRGPKLTPPQVQIIVDWINQGALDN